MVSFKLISAATVFVFAGVCAAAPAKPATAAPAPAPAVGGGISQQLNSTVTVPSGVTSGSPNVHYDHGKHLGQSSGTPNVHYDNGKHLGQLKGKGVAPGGPLPVDGAAPTSSAAGAAAASTDGTGAGTLPQASGAVTAVAGTSGV